MNKLKDQKINAGNQIGNHSSLAYPKFLRCDINFAINDSFFDLAKLSLLLFCE